MAAKNSDNEDIFTSDEDTLIIPRREAPLKKKIGQRQIIMHRGRTYKYIYTPLSMSSKGRGEQ